MTHSFDRVFDGLFAPMPDFNKPFEADTRDLGAMIDAFRDAPHVLIEKSVRSAFILSVSAYCSCGHRQVHHDGGLGSCRYDECGCVGWMPEAR